MVEMQKREKGIKGINGKIWKSVNEWWELSL